MLRPNSINLHFGPYRTPRFKYGQNVECTLIAIRLRRRNLGLLGWAQAAGAQTAGAVTRFAKRPRMSE